MVKPTVNLQKVPFQRRGEKLGGVEGKQRIQRREPIGHGMNDNSLT